MGQNHYTQLELFVKYIKNIYESKLKLDKLCITLVHKFIVDY